MPPSQAALTQPLALPRRPTPSGRKPPRGEATTALVVSAHVGTNANVFPQLLVSHVVPGTDRRRDVRQGHVLPASRPRHCHNSRYSTIYPEI